MEIMQAINISANNFMICNIPALHCKLVLYKLNIQLLKQAVKYKFI